MPLLPPPLVRKPDPKDGAEPIPYPDVVRTWTDRYLHSRLAKAEQHPYHREVLASELRNREAWRSPASWALAISLVSLLASVAALIVAALHR